MALKTWGMFGLKGGVFNKNPWRKSGRIPYSNFEEAPRQRRDPKTPGNLLTTSYVRYKPVPFAIEAVRKIITGDY